MHAMLESRAPVALPTLALLLCGGCSGWFFSGVQYPDRSRPVVRIETSAGVEYGAATEVGVLFLGRTATEGPCRVHQFLGDDLLVEDGRIDPFGGIYFRATIDRKHQHAPLWTGRLARGDELVALVMGDASVQSVGVNVSNDSAVDGDALDAPGIPLPAGTPLFREERGRLWFVGLVTGAAELEEQGLGRRAFVVFAGPDRLAEALAVPENAAAPLRIKYRPDNLWVEEPLPRETIRR
ncbi:MAG: hypothetical protein HZB39_01725 [Planctomycetes bacterium]|nr:hypothetical protein [Planctomycetota bacterium]